MENNQMTSEDVKEIPKMVEDGMSLREIASKYGVHERTVGQWVKKLRASGYDIKTRVGRRPINLN